MLVKGAYTSAVSEFVKQKHGNDGYSKWYECLSQKGKEIFGGTVLLSSWYPVEEGLVEPIKKICDLFYNGNLDYARDIGKFASKHALTWYYKIFYKAGSPRFVIDMGARVFKMYQKPGVAKSIYIKDNSALWEIYGVKDLSGVWEEVIAGWVMGALELSGSQSQVFNITKSPKKGDEIYEFDIKWN